jgi:general secretion pathway protein D
MAQARPAVPAPNQTGETNPDEIKPNEVEQPAHPGVAQSAKPSGGPVSFYFEDADIFDVIQTVFGDILKVNYVIDQRVKGKVTFRTVNPIPRGEVLSIMETVLRLNGVGFVEEKGLYRIIPLSDVPNELVYAQMGKLPAKVAIEMFTFKNLNVKESMSEIENAVGLTTQLGRVNIIPIYRLNAILAVSSHKAALEYVRRWVEEFDTMFANAKPKIMVYPLQNSKAKHVAEMLQSIFSGGSGGGTSSPATSPLTPKTATATTPATRSPAMPAQTATQTMGPAATVTGTGFLVSPETRIFADEISNSLVILAIPADYDFIRDTIRKIDTVPRQVAIEGLLVRVDITDNLDFGMQWAIQNHLTIKGFTQKDINIAGPLTLSTPLSDPLQNPAMFQFTAFDAAGNIKLALQSLATVGKAKILASPHILVADNREARIQVGQQIPIATSTTSTPLTSATTGTEITTTNTSTSTIQYKDIGIILKVKPQINDSGLVSLEVSQEVSSQGADVNIAGQAFTSINKTEATTNLVAKDGETIIIGGLIREDTTNSRSGIPFLSRIPVLGYLFGSTKDDTTRAELIILLTPHVVRNMDEAGNVTSDYVEKYKGVTKDKQIEQFIRERSQKQKKGGDEEINGSK